jgi:hypothetical protein
MYMSTHPMRLRLSFGEGTKASVPAKLCLDWLVYGELDWRLACDSKKFLVCTSPKTALSTN